MPFKPHAVSAACVFHSYFRLEASFHFLGTLTQSEDLAKTLRARLVVDGRLAEGKAECRPLPDNQSFELVLEALIDRSRFPNFAELELTSQDHTTNVSINSLMRMARDAAAPSLATKFDAAIGARELAQPSQRPRLLDFGGRARSGLERRGFYPTCDVTVFDILADASVDVVGDAHEASRYFAPSSFDFVLCVSVFEHLLMPWKVVLELNTIMKPGGTVLVHTHQTIGMHDLPWDFWRFSDTSWNSLFNAATGFEIIETSLQDFMHVVPRVWDVRYALSEGSGGFEGSTVLARKVSDSRLSWPVSVGDVLKTSYPA